MNRLHWRRVALVLGCFSISANAGTLSIWTFGGDFSPSGNGAPDSLNAMSPASSASVTNVQTPVGDGNTGFNGGLVALNNLLYTIGNDSNGVATLYSLQATGTGLTPVSSGFNNTGDAAGVIFQNGLAAVSGSFYAIGQGATTEDLYRIGAGAATHIAALNTFGGTFAGLAWDPNLNSFYAIIANTVSGDLLVQVTLGGSVSTVANLTTLDGAEIGTHLGGLADAGAGILYDIYTDPATFTGQLEQINLNGAPTATTLYDTQIPLAQNAGVALIPEPAPGMEIGAGLVLLSLMLRRAATAALPKRRLGHR
jgi:hypothetical protein